MESGNFYSEATEFSKNIIHNVCNYFMQTKFNEEEDYLFFSKLYSKFCHAVIIDYLDENGNNLYQELKYDAKLLNENELDEIIECQFQEWFSLETNPSDSHYYVVFAKVAILGIVISLNNPKLVFKSTEMITDLTEAAIKLGILKDNYDETRNEAKSLINAVYKWGEMDFRHFVTELDKKSCWKDKKLPLFAINYLKINALQLQIKWKKSEHFKEMNRAKFVDLIEHMYTDYAKDYIYISSIHDYIFILIISIFSLHCCTECNFSQGTEITIDFVSRSLKKNSKLNDAFIIRIH